MGELLYLVFLNEGFVRRGKDQDYVIEEGVPRFNFALRPNDKVTVHVFIDGTLRAINEYSVLDSTLKRA